MKTSGALLVTGEWGSGKTYHIENKVFPKVVEDTQFTPLIISLYGETDKNNIPNRVLFAYLDSKGKDSKFSTTKLAESMSNISEAVPFVKKFVDLRKVITGTAENIFKLLPHDQILICFDDLERMSEEVDINDFLGIINDLVEKKNAKVLLIANEDEIKDDVTFKEKTVEKTIHFIPNFSHILDDLIDSYSESAFKTYLKSNKDLILESLEPNISEDDFKRELGKSFANIRTIKFSLEHFKYVFEILEKNRNISEELVLKQLKNLWIFCLAVSVEFRKPNSISFKERKGLDELVSSIGDLDISQFDFSQMETTDRKPTLNDLEYNERFKRLYYNRLGEDYIFYPQFYDLITSGKEMESKSFIEQLEKSFKVNEEGKINPAHQLLQDFMHGWWTFTNEEFAKKIITLLENVEQGKLEDITSYLNSGVYLLGFSEILGKKTSEITQTIKNGLDKRLGSTRIDYVSKTRFEMISGDFNSKELKEVVAYVEKKFAEIEKKQRQEEIKELEKLLENDLEAFVKKFIQEDVGFRTPDTPIFHKISVDAIKSAIKNWEPKGIMDLISLFKSRYLDSGFADRVSEEITFLENMEMSIKELDLKTKNLSNHMIKTQLSPQLEECKNALQQTLK
ncbi:hypothetical protein [Marinoscillum sp.]|uniref:hypothetical protein n=1 Tax=Marinoscillum sp. TaxID=2024838 RepID=UPI003BAC9A23